METINKIENFLADIYFKMPYELNNEYIDICEQISGFFEKTFLNYDEIMQQGRDIIQFLFDVMKTGDYIKMADALNYDIKPIIEDALLFIEREKLNN